MSIAVATADEVEVLRAEIARIAAELAAMKSGTGAREVFDPKEIAKRFRMRVQTVREACQSGALACEVRSHARGTAYRITIEAARAWRASVAATNQ